MWKNIYIYVHAHKNSEDIYHKMFLDQFDVSFRHELLPHNSGVIRRAWKTRASGQVNKVSQTEKNGEFGRSTAWLGEVGSGITILPFAVGCTGKIHTIRFWWDGINEPHKHFLRKSLRIT